MSQYSSAKIEARYQSARDLYASLGVDTDAALKRLATIPISLHCWQGDDVGGFESAAGLTGGGILSTGNYPGRARTPDELRGDLDKVYSLLPGKHRLNLHAIYGDFTKKVERTAVGPEHFARWIDWAKAGGIGIDFNQTFFSHPKAADGFTLAHNDPSIREYWIEHGKACRKIAAEIGKQLGSTSVCNVWVPDGFKDVTVDRNTPRHLLKQSLDAMFAEKLNPEYMKDCVECKLFGIGSEFCVIGSHEFYMGYAIRNNTLLCLDAGHFHPTEVISDKVTSILTYLPEILLHVSRGVRWDSDHVVIVTDELVAIAQEIVRHNFDQRVHIGLDFFDGSINRIAAWTIGTRSMIKALLMALLEPTATLRGLEQKADYTARLALLEEQKTLPVGAIWDYYLLQQDVAVGADWLADVRRYESDVLSKRK